MLIPLVDLRSQYRALQPELDEAVGRVLSEGRFILGPEVAAFEREFAAFTGSAHAVGVDSGTSALELVLRASGIGPGDEVVTVAFTFVASVAAIEYTGATPVLVDIEPATLLMDPTRIEAAITPRTRAIIPVHLYGQPADMDAIMAIARRHDLLVIEDACQAHAATYGGRAAGTIGAAGAFSFYPGKNLGAAGDAGAIVTDDADLAERVRVLRDWGAPAKYEHVVRGYNKRLDELQAAILRVKLRHLDDWTRARQAHARWLRQRLAGTGLEFVAEAPGRTHAYHLLVARTANRTAFRQQLEAASVSTGVHYPIPVHLQPAYRDLGYAEGALPVTEAAAREVVSLPLYPELGPEELERIAVAVDAALKVEAGIA